MISKGLLDQARENARKNIAALAPYAKQGMPIIGLEPSCLLTFRDEYLDLLPNNGDAKVVAENSYLIEEFLTKDERRMTEAFVLRPPSSVLFHAHCYQKALTGSKPLLKLLQSTGAQVSEINSGCCGMAGAFGYEAEHYDISMKIGADQLFPAVQAADMQTVIVASGTSCRHQIEHGTGRKALHPIEWLATQLSR